mmetsp:Transcript_63412/g.185420  ORF Transcript_63412/g.185420 Transcript_63412/m.185420 type:complete len:87 (+) Transcript_63412:321-581(+)
MRTGVSWGWCGDWAMNSGWPSGLPGLSPKVDGDLETAGGWIPAGEGDLMLTSRLAGDPDRSIVGDIARILGSWPFMKSSTLGGSSA